MLVLAQFIQALSMSVVVGMIYFRLEKDQQTVRDWFGLMYIIGAMYPYLVILDLIAVCKFLFPRKNEHSLTYKKINLEGLRIYFDKIKSNKNFIREKC